MGAFLIVAIICVLLATVYMFRLFPHPSVLKQPLVCAHIGSVWFVSLLPIALVPADVWKAINTDASDEGILPALWIVAYIYPMVTQLVTMPMHQEIDAAKDFTLKARWKTALKINGRLYAILGGIGILGLLLLIVTGELNSDGVVGFVIAFSNTLGLTLGILLFGYGLVDVPRKLWASANWPEKKRYLLYKVAKGHEKVIKSHFEVSKMMVKVQDTSSQIRANNPLRPEMDIIVAEASEDANFQMATNARQSLSEGGEYDAWEFSDTVESLADLRTLLFKAQRSFFQDSSHLIYNAEKVLDLDDNSASAERADGTFTSWRASDQGWLSTKLGISTEKWSHWEYIWKCKLQRPAYRALSIIFGISSVLMVQSECLILYEGNPYLAVVALWTHQGNQCQSDAHTGIIIGSLLPVVSDVCPHRRLLLERATSLKNAIVSRRCTSSSARSIHSSEWVSYHSTSSFLDGQIRSLCSTTPCSCQDLHQLCRTISCEWRKWIMGIVSTKAVRTLFRRARMVPTMTTTRASTIFSASPWTQFRF